MAATAKMTAARVRGERARQQAAGRARTWTARPAAALVAFLVAVAGYAAFAHGSTSLQGQARVLVALAAAAVVVVAVWLSHGALPLSASRTAWLGLGLLVGFAIWTGLSLDWSVAGENEGDRFGSSVSAGVSYAGPDSAR